MLVFGTFIERVGSKNIDSKAHERNPETPSVEKTSTTLRLSQSKAHELKPKTLTAQKTSTTLRALSSV
jgi:hypothetical protein